MHAATTRLAKGFWSRSLDEFKRLSNIAIKMEGIKGPSGPFELHSFRSPESLENCKVMSDADLGGFTTSNLDWIPSREPISTASAPETPPLGPSGYARFHGTISTKLPANRPEVQRTGYAGWRTLDRRSTLFGRSLWDIDMYGFLAMRVKSDGRSYMVNVMTESVVPTDLHQHRLFSKNPGEWETVVIRWNDFVRTNGGYAVEPQTEILRQKVRSIGVALTDRIPGPFQLYIDRIWATNDPREADGATSVTNMKEGELKNKQGKNIAWGSK
ncbi:complex I intermediate-associated protein 30-domain-containing protein [Lasiosphaeria miniovina]|uniref:Complex I intermediate-associated protein 30-domain-containing protein n=1 Tax=Lasiosphaeria miniovina TaxID=1954250 RepID=A0AA40DGW4_9PEZI|nr:complex I intermediate-associated protein 30-domain-containing protein [Lasiosphaeria miniovina]KAK0703054.1 complex I intermediate-associated protein 30-domain-containing protein [Lasiosphaeria miniovina]